MTDLTQSLVDMPNFRSDREVDQFLSGKPTRAELSKAIENTHKSLQSSIDNQFLQVHQAFSNLSNLTRLHGLQIETLVRFIDSVVPDFKKNYHVELNKTLSFTVFLDSVNPPGEHSGKPMQERINLVREWNKTEGNIKAEGFHFGLPKYILAHLSEFTPQELADLNQEFNMSIEIPKEDNG